MVIFADYEVVRATGRRGGSIYHATRVHVTDFETLKICISVDETKRPFS